MDADLLDLLLVAKQDDKTSEPGGTGKHIDPLFQDAYDDFKAASNARDAAEAMRLMLRLVK